MFKICLKTDSNRYLKKLKRLTLLTLTAVILASSVSFAAAGVYTGSFSRSTGPYMNSPWACDETTGHANINGYVESEREKMIWSYVQVPLKYYNDPKWTGDWVEHEWGGQKFFYFGCGVCCLANIYCTMTSGRADPEEMLEMAKERTGYNPDSGRGALSWSQLNSMCSGFGLNTTVKRKPETYESFRDDVAASETTLVLVCKDNDDKLWFYTNGHYVNLWEYDPATDTCFVTDSSGLFNRDRVCLPDVYAALKTSSDAQYMTVDR